MDEKEEGGWYGGRGAGKGAISGAVAELARLPGCLAACLGAHAIIIFINGAGARKEVAFNAVYVPTYPPSLHPCPSLSYIKCILIMEFTYSFLLHPQAKATPPSPLPRSHCWLPGKLSFHVAFLVDRRSKEDNKMRQGSNKVNK